jgi:NAD(P)-dependent dehydrogenase (short-subunit alcohol dehydrogenase family)
MNITLITGANKGIGLETARRIGGTVLVGARHTARGTEAAATLTGEGVDARFVRVDVTDAGSVADAAKWIDAEFGRLDVLVNNAGISPASAYGAPSEVALDGVRETFETNVFGVITVTNAMLPLLRRSPAGRIVNVSSELGSLGLALDQGQPFYPFNLIAYNSSKTALNAVTVAYAKELLDTPIKVNAVNPGYCATDLNAHSGYRTPAEGAAVVIGAAGLPADGPTGSFLTDDQALVVW